MRPRRSTSRPVRTGARKRRGASGLLLFLAGMLAGGLAFYFGCRESPRERPRTEEPDRRAGRPAPAHPRRKEAKKTERTERKEERTAGERASAARREPPAAEPAAGIPVAVVIDDLGRSLEEVAALERLGVRLSYAVLPFEERTPEVVAALRRRHEEILCHLPMEPANGADPGPGALRSDMTGEELRAAAEKALAAVPGASGVNNHMGSELSADERSMDAVLALLPPRKLFFLDSRTSPKSVGYRVATELGIPAAERQVFLDDDLRPEAIRAQFARLLEFARQRGAAIAIGHPHPATLAALAAEIPRAEAQGYRFVPVSFLLDRPAEPE